MSQAKLGSVRGGLKRNEQLFEDVSSDPPPSPPTCWSPGRNIDYSPPRPRTLLSLRHQYPRIGVMYAVCPMYVLIVSYLCLKYVLCIMYFCLQYGVVMT